MLQQIVGTPGRAILMRSPFDDVVFLKLAVERHAGPVELLRGLAHIPVGGEKGGEQTLALIRYSAIGGSALPPEWVGQVCQGNPLCRLIDKRGLKQVFQLTHVARPIVADQAGQRLVSEPFHLPSEVLIQRAQIVMT